MTLKEKIAEIVGSRRANFIPHDKAVDKIIQAVIEAMPKEIRAGKHDGHDHDQNWCYVCNRTDDEEEFTDSGWNSCRTEILRTLGEK